MEELLQRDACRFHIDFEIDLRNHEQRVSRVVASF